VFVKRAGRGISRFRMIEEGDRILIGASGGKDSLALSLALSVRRAWVPIHYECEALFIDWREYPVGQAELDGLAAFYRRLDIPLHVVSASMFPLRYEKPFNCYICSRNRRRILFREAQARGMRKIALGHTRDDIIVTTLMNLFYRGEFATMLPVQSFFAGRIQILRPLCEVEERDIQRLLRYYPLPVLERECPRKEHNLRPLFKEVIRMVERTNRHVRDNLYRAPWHINRDYLPGPIEPAGD
jgi:tRNA 2-thiocytidine biosynthesis protein TtcA